MKILVDEMPYFTTECPFYDGYDCRIDRQQCERFLAPCGERDMTECRNLKTFEYYKREVNDQ